MTTWKGFTPEAHQLKLRKIENENHYEAEISSQYPVDTKQLADIML